MLRWIGLTLVAILVLVATITVLRPKVGRTALGLDPAPAESCMAAVLPSYPLDSFNPRIVANDYLGFAVATLNVYDDGAPNGFSFDKHSPEWRMASHVVAPEGGLAFDVYHKDEPELFSVLTVFRGTDTLDRLDWIANLSWFVQWLPISTQYDTSREVFRDIRKQAFQMAGGKKVAFIAAGHSLGGGIAQHISYAFPCVSAAVFNASFVTNVFRLAEPYPAQVINVFEKNDELTRLGQALHIKPDGGTSLNYPVEVIRENVFQHSMTAMALGLARQVVYCQIRPSRCPIPESDQRARRLYCESFGKGRDACRNFKVAAAPTKD